MIEVYEGLRLYQSRIAKSSLDEWPEIWAAHYSIDGLLGELGGRVEPGGEANATYWALVPFAFSSSVVTSFVFFEGSTAPGPYVAFLEADPVLYATRMHYDGAGVLATHWVIPYRIKEGGVRLFDAPYKSPFYVPKLFECVGLMMERRNTSALYSFEETVAAAIRGDDGFTDV